MRRCLHCLHYVNKYFDPDLAQPGLPGKNVDLSVFLFSWSESVEF